jgi:ubiquinone biosynthesis protein
MRQRRHAGRYREITTVLLEHGLGGLLEPLGLRLRRRGITIQSDSGVDDGAATGPSNRALHLRLALQELGPTFIKLGQILSTRSDIVPPDIIAELVKLQDRVPAAPFSQIEIEIERELGGAIDALFAEFSEIPIAAASIGQVHAARLRDGRDVVVKVQRPGVQTVIDEDLAILSDLARATSRRVAQARRLDLQGLISEFDWTLRGELDYLREGRNAERFGRMFADDKSVVIPEIHWAHCTSRVLTMERLRGCRIDDVRGIEAAGLRREDVAVMAANLLFKEVFQEGFFHADPHPGNFLVTTDGRIGAMDFGMVGALNERLREQLLFTLFAVTEQDTPRIVDDLVTLGAANASVDRPALERDVDHMLAQYYGRTLDQVQIGRVLNDVMALVRRHQIRLPSELALLSKTIMMSEAVGRQLDPAFQVTAVAEPFVRNAMRRYYRPEYWRSRLRMKPLEAMLLATSLPGQTQRLLTRIERNQLTFHMHYDELDETIQALNGMINRLALSVLVAAMGIGLAVLYQASDSPVRTWLAALFALGFIVIVFVAVALLIAIWRSNRD